MIGVYKITNQLGQVYIGQSKNLKRRIVSYDLSNGINQRKLNESIIKFGAKNHILEIIEECELSELSKRERYWQDFYSSNNENGLNCVLTAGTVMRIREKREVPSNAGRPKVENGKARKIVLTDDEFILVKDFIKLNRNK